MAHKQFSRVGETSTSTGTGAKTLAGAISGYKQFSDVLSNGDTIDVLTVMDADWEIARCTYASAGDTLTPARVHASSNGGAAVNWGAGTKTMVSVDTGLSDLDATGLTNLLTLLGITAAAQSILDDASTGAILTTLGAALARGNIEQAGVGSDGVASTSSSFADVTGCTVPVVAGTYYFVAAVFAEATNNAGADCILGVNGPTASSIKANGVRAYNSSGNIGTTSATVTAYDTDIINAAQQNDRGFSIVLCRVVFTASGTFALRFKRTGGAGTATVRSGAVLFGWRTA